MADRDQHEDQHEAELLEASQYLSGERDFLDDDEGADSDGDGDVDVDAAEAEAQQPVQQPAPQPQVAQQGQQQPAQDQTAHYYTFLSNKAGMEGVSKEEVARIVHEASVNSRYFMHQQRQDAKLQQRIEAIQAKCATLSGSQRRILEEQADRELQEAERAHRSYDRVCCVVDLDAFFAAVEERDRPELRTKPFAVGGGVICTASYVARRFGVRSAMPSFIAKRLCPQLLILPTRFEAYTEVAEQTRAIFREYDPAFRAGSLDEAYLDLTAVVKARAAAAGVRVPPASGQQQQQQEEEEEEEDGEEEDGEEQHGGGDGAFGGYWALAEAVVAEVRARILEVCRITASAGIASSFMLAKIASNERKPNGQFLVRDVPSYLHPLPVRSVGGIGRKTERVLTAGLGIHTVQDLHAKRALLYHAFTPLTAHWLATRYLGVDLAGGEDEAEGGGGGGAGGYGRKGISKERTFEVISRQDEILRKLREICEGLAGDMKEEGLQARCVTLKLKDSAFNVTTRAKTLAHYVASADELFEAAHAVLLSQLPISLRLMGVRASAFRPKPAKDQGTLDAFLAKGGSGAAVLDPFAAPAGPSPPKRKEMRGNNGTIEAFLAKRSASAMTSSSHHNNQDDGVIVIDDFSPPPSQVQQAQASATAASSSYACPICGLVRAGESLAAFNQHVDGCLARTDPCFVESRKREQQQQLQEGGAKGSKKKRAAGPLDAFVLKQNGK